MKQAALILAIFSTILLETNAQPYQSMFGKDSTEWIINWYNLDDFDNYDSILAEKDTIVDGHTYKKVVVKNIGPSNYDALFREDTITGKVWYRPVFPISAEDTAEVLAFDFSLEVGDTFDISNMELGGVPYFSSVDSVRYINGLKYIYFDVQYQWAPNPSALPSEPYTIIEGIGSNMGPLWKQIWGELRGQYLMCSYKDGERTNYENIRYEGQCPQPWSGIYSTDYHAPLVVNVYPNPVSESFQITGLEDQTIFLLEIFNSMGQKVKSIPNFQKQTVEVGGLPRGLYFFRIVLEDKKALHSRFIIHP